ncbi:MAG: 4Fe-4S dicluster domain-containing protein [Candidatus Eremiobacteraeota bacterium]|nr:4Fe-4S dicluster domain-containing protein [Candidatus Eremiobacteraeota bacterium]
MRRHLLLFLRADFCSSRGVLRRRGREVRGVTAHSVRGFDGDDRPPADVFNRCIRCGLCLPTCPTYLETMTETSGPRGRIGLIKAVSEGRLDLCSDGFVSQMHECLDCRACEAACPSGVAYGELLETARVQIRRAQEPQSPSRGVRNALFAALTNNRALLRVAGVLLFFMQRTGLAALARAFGLREAFDLTPRISGRFFFAAGQRYVTANAQGLALLHTGCVMQVMFANVHEASVRMLRRASLSVIVPREQTCCGALAVHAGDIELARRLAKRNIEAYERSGADVYVVNAAGCGSALKEYARYFAGDPEWQQRAARFSARVRDITEVLDAVTLDSRMGTLDARVTYQDPCHLAHAQRVTGAPRRLLERIPGLRLIEMREASVCCGGAGTYNLTQPEMSGRLRARKVDAIVQTGARVVATANPGCAMQITAGLRAANYDADVKHVVELLDDAYTLHRNA